MLNCLDFIRKLENNICWLVMKLFGLVFHYKISWLNRIRFESMVMAFMSKMLNSCLVSRGNFHLLILTPKGQLYILRLTHPIRDNRGNCYSFY